MEKYQEATEKAPGKQAEVAPLGYQCTRNDRDMLKRQCRGEISDF